MSKWHIIQLVVTVVFISFIILKERRYYANRSIPESPAKSRTEATTKL